MVRTSESTAGWGSSVGEDQQGLRSSLSVIVISVRLVADPSMVSLKSKERMPVTVL